MWDVFGTIKKELTEVTEVVTELAAVTYDAATTSGSSSAVGLATDNAASAANVNYVSKKKQRKSKRNQQRGGGGETADRFANPMFVDGDSMPMDVEQVGSKPSHGGGGGDTDDEEEEAED